MVFFVYLYTICHAKIRTVSLSAMGYSVHIGWWIMTTLAAYERIFFDHWFTIEGIDNAFQVLIMMVSRYCIRDFWCSIYFNLKIFIYGTMTENSRSSAKRNTPNIRPRVRSVGARWIRRKLTIFTERIIKPTRIHGWFDDHVSTCELDDRTIFHVYLESLLATRRRKVNWNSRVFSFAEPIR